MLIVGHAKTADAEPFLEKHPAPTTEQLCRQNVTAQRRQK
jgi:hypothetical protein